MEEFYFGSNFDELWFDVFAIFGVRIPTICTWYRFNLAMTSLNLAFCYVEVNMVGKGLGQYSNFIRTIIDTDLKIKKNDGIVVTRFPPEPNGYLHLGHAKAICLNFQIANSYGGVCNLRFDDTNPVNEQNEYVDAIIKDIKWLGFDWGKKEFYTSDYFDALYGYALVLIKASKAYVDDLSSDDIRLYRGSLTELGKNSPFRERSVNENLSLFNKMKLGEFEDGEKVLRAKIDMAHPNLIMRDPLLYRIRKIKHHKVNNKWCIYPMYDFAHCLSDSIEGVSHSLCTLEFENNRPLYDWILNNADVGCHPSQIEFARLNLSFAVLSKRKLRALVDGGYVSGWDDPRMPTISGLRRRGYTAESICNFCNRIGIAKRASTVDMALLEHSVREDLNRNAPRVMAVLNPLKVVITNYPDGVSEYIDAINNPEDISAGTRKVPFSKEIYIEKEDFMENPPKKFFRLGPGREVRLRYAFLVTCTEVIKDNCTGEVTEIRCIYDPETRGGNAPDGHKVKATLHWVSVAHAINAKVHLYDRLFTEQCLDEDFTNGNLEGCLNPNSLKILEDCKLEPSLSDVKPGFFCQFERLGYFCLDAKDSSKNTIVFNRTVPLRDTWVKLKNKMGK